MSTTTVTPTVFIEARDLQPVPYGLLSVAQVTDSNRHLPLEWESICSTTPGIAPDICNYDGDPVDFDPSKEDTYSTDTALTMPVTLYARTTCRLVGGRMERAKGTALAVLNAGEGNALAQALLGLVGDDAEATTIAVSGDGLPDGAKIALAHAENAARSFAGGGVILAPTFVASFMGLKVVGDHLETPLGTPVALYETEGDVTTWRILALSQIAVGRGPAQTPEPVVATESNEYVVIAERPYSIGYDCAAVEITLAA